jgi:hypothetical protein
LASSQFKGDPAPQEPFEQTSAPLQTSPSPQALVVKEQPLSQQSPSTALPSSQSSPDSTIPLPQSGQVPQSAEQLLQSSLPLQTPSTTQMGAQRHPSHSQVLPSAEQPVMPAQAVFESSHSSGGVIVRSPQPGQAPQSWGQVLQSSPPALKQTPSPHSHPKG